MLALVSLGLMLDTVLYAALAVWRLRVGGARGAPLLLGLSFAGMALWCLAMLVSRGAVPLILEEVRNVLWIAYLGLVIRNDRAVVPQRWIAGLPYILATLAGAGAIFVGGISLGSTAGEWPLLLALGCSLAFCVGALIFVHSLYLAAHRAASGFRLILFALAVMWAYDLNLYAAALLGFRLPAVAAEFRGILALVLVFVFGIAAHRRERWGIALSRKVAFQSLSVVAIGGYFVFVSTIASARPWLGNTVGAAGQMLAVIVVSAATITFLISARLRARARVFIAKHLFEHRYDYRTEWLRFNATINSGGLTGLSPEQRAVKALVDLMDAAGGVLFLRSGHDRLTCAATFEWPGRSPAEGEMVLPGELLELIEHDSHVMISPRYDAEQDHAEFPQELAADAGVWLAVPLVRMSGLVGMVALGRPSVPRRLDWEDFDLLKVLGQQIATYIADAQNQAELEEARQFEEFNRRFAFIVHDIKNVASQLSLVAANAEYHGANPRFQADMTSTLRNSVGKMTTLLSRLSLERHAPELQLAEVDAIDLMREIVAARRAQHPLSIAQSDPVRIVADRARLHTALDHLVQNAIEASGPSEPVLLSVQRQDRCGILSVLDVGTGMSADFIHRQLFKPFASTKKAGFGIGAGEARALVRQMDGELEVQSVEGVGTSFIIKLPLAAPQQESRS